MYLGIEIGGTKLQFGVAAGDGLDWAAFERCDVDPRRGATGILEQIERVGTELLQRFAISRIGVGFGGPVDSTTGRVTKSHQIDGWEGVPLGDWCAARLGRPARIGNDCDVAALAEASYGAGRGKSTVFYVTVGTGVGGGLVTGGRMFGAGRPAVAEIGHLRPGLAADQPSLTVESIASGRGIEAAARAALGGTRAASWEAAWRGIAARQLGQDVGMPQGIASEPRYALCQPSLCQSSAEAQEFSNDLLRRAGGERERITARLVAEAAAAGNHLAVEILHGACRTLGWAIAQVITLLAPDVVVVGGGIALMGEEMFFRPLRREVQRYAFPPLAKSYEIVPAALGESVVVHGAVALAAAD